MLANNNTVAATLNEPEHSVVPESLLTLTPLISISNTYKLTPRPAGAVPPRAGTTRALALTRLRTQAFSRLRVRRRAAFRCRCSPWRRAS